MFKSVHVWFAVIEDFCVWKVDVSEFQCNLIFMGQSCEILCFLALVSDFAWDGRLAAQAQDTKFEKILIYKLKVRENFL